MVGSRDKLYKEKFIYIYWKNKIQQFSPIYPLPTPLSNGPSEKFTYICWKNKIQQFSPLYTLPTQQTVKWSEWKFFIYILKKQNPTVFANLPSTHTSPHHSRMVRVKIVTPVVYPCLSHTLRPLTIVRMHESIDERIKIRDRSPSPVVVSVYKERHE